MMNHRITCAALAAALAAFACSLASAQWAPFSALPGADRVDRGQVGGSAGRVSEVRWDLPGGKAWFQYAGKWKSVPLAGGAAAEGEPPAAPEVAKRYQAPKGGRARQATRVPSPDGAWNAVFADCNVSLEPAAGGERVAVTTEGRTATGSAAPTGSTERSSSRTRPCGGRPIPSASPTTTSTRRR